MPYDIRLLGRPITISTTAASAGAGATTINIKPATGKLWLISFLFGYQTSGGNRDCVWNYKDPVNDAALYETLSLATSTRWYFNLHPTSNANCVFGPIVAHALRYPKFIWTATGAAENGYVKGIALEVDLGVG